MEKGDRLIKAEPCAHVLPLNHYTRALEKPEKRSQEALITDRKVAGSNHGQGEVFISLFRFQSRDNDDFSNLAYSCACWKFIHVKCVRF